jgi:hypothetical protein
MTTAVMEIRSNNTSPVKGGQQNTSKCQIDPVIT